MRLLSIFGKKGMSKVPRVMECLGTDMHCHLLPAVDDGSSDFSETVDLLTVMGKLGFKKVYLTPHYQARYPNEPDDIARRFAELKKQLSTIDTSHLPEVAGVSGEYRFDDYYGPKPGVDKVTPLPGKRLLCEFSRFGFTVSPLDTFRRFKEMGYTLILAHPERYPFVNPNSPEVVIMRDMGVLFQVNTLSLFGFYGETARTRGFEFIGLDMVDYLGTDMHNMRYATALVQAANDKKIRRIIESGRFRNAEL